MTRYVVLYAIGLAVYGTLAFERLGKQSVAPHYVYQADAWLHGRATIEQPVPGGWGNDWAKVDTVRTADGREVEGRFTRQRAFRTLAGEIIAAKDVRVTVGTTAYMSFPPAPTVLMLPSALVGGKGGNDTIPDVLVAALIPALALLVLRRLAQAKLSERSESDDLWLALLLPFGTVMFYVAVQGSVWHFAHVCGVVAALVYAWAAIESKHPIAAGLALGFAALTRPPMAFMFPLFVLEAVRMHGWRGAIRPVLRFTAPIVAFALAGGVYNLARFGSFTEFGHTYLDVRQQAQIEQYGLFSFHYLLRNLAVAFAQIPLHRMLISGHGLAMWVTTPALALLVSKTRSPIRRALWITVACVALPSLLYQNTGWVQFGYRFSLDYMVFLIMLIACCGWRMTILARVLIVVSVVINVYGAVIFDRYNTRFEYDYDHIKVFGGIAEVAN